MGSPSIRRAALHSAALFAAGSGLTRALEARRLRGRDHRLFILEYHDISLDGSEFEGSISQARFRRHLEWLGKRYQFSTLGEASERLASAAGLDRDLVVLTFDDGYEGNFTGAWPVLESEGVPAAIFLTTGFIDGKELWFDLARRCLDAAKTSPSSLSAPARDGLVALFGRWPRKTDSESLVQHLKYMDPEVRSALLGKLETSPLDLAPRALPLSWDQVREMQKGGIEFGGHTVTHPILSLLSKGEQESEIVQSRQRILEETGVLPMTFAYPNGSRQDYTEETVKILSQAGFQAACTTRRGSNRPHGDSLTLRRIGVGSDPTWVVEARLAGLFDEQTRRLLSIVSPWKIGS